MKYIKTYEASNQPERVHINEYVLCKEQNIGYNNKATRYFIENTIGKYIMNERTKENNNYCIEYENIPDELKYSDDFFTNPITNLKNIRWMKRREIIFHSKDKMKLEIKLISSKYNL